MRLPVPMCKLPIRFDVDRLKTELDALDSSLWINHPGGFEPSRNIILISVDGGANDDFASAGRMQPTAALEASPYIQQVLASLEAPITRARLTAIDGPAQLMPHEDANYHWFERTRIHIPIVTAPAVRFEVDDRAQHMAAGEAWVFDNFRKHSVVNPTNLTRVHLILDTKGSPSFWAMFDRVARSEAEVEARFVRFDEQARPRLEIEEYRFEVPAPSQVDGLIGDVLPELSGAFRGDLQTANEVAAELSGFRQSWRRTFAEYGATADGEDSYRELLDQLGATLSRTSLKRRLFRYGNAYGALAVLSTVFQVTNRMVDLSGKRLA